MFFGSAASPAPPLRLPCYCLFSLAGDTFGPLLSLFEDDIWPFPRLLSLEVVFHRGKHDLASQMTNSSPRLYGITKESVKVHYRLT